MYLNCHTSLSFKYGTLSPQELFEEAKRCNISRLALTEINNTSSYVEMLRICEQNKPAKDVSMGVNDGRHRLEVVVGVEVRQSNTLLYITLARNNNGFSELNRFLSHQSATNTAFSRHAPAFTDVFVIYPFAGSGEFVLRENEYVGVTLGEVNQLALCEHYKNCPGKYVLLHPVTFADKIDHNIHRLMRAIDNNTLLSKLAPHQHAMPDEVMLPESEIITKLKGYTNLATSANQLLNQCRLEYQLGQDKNKKNLYGSDEADWNHLVEHAWSGFMRLYDPQDEKILERFERELTIIKRKEFCAYYLIAFDLISFARKQGFDFVGRGSGANSMVAYCLGITNVDPVELNLYFERFLNEERTTPPDFDIDFSWDNRDAIYEYLFEKYGRDHVCLLGTHVTFQFRSILRELAKVFGLPKDEIEAMLDNPRQAEKRDHITELIFRYASYMRDMPQNLSIHAGGVLITEKPISDYTATDLPPKGYPVSHLDMHSAEDLGIFKFDILSQRGLGHLKDAVSLVKQNRSIDIDLKRFSDFKRDHKIRELMRHGKTMGCFYVESPAMRMLLQKLRCEDYLTLVAASSIIRPGVSSSGMMQTYIERFHAVRNGGSYRSIHPKMDELLSETYGVMVYQEDVIKVAHHFGGLTLTEADVLRRGMSGKYRSRNEFQRVREKFIENCRSFGYEESVIKRVWYEIESFSGYSFAKGHSASYAVESYQSLYLKAHFPLEFMVAVINNFGGFYKTEFYFHEARMNGGRIQAPCINHSERLTTLSGSDIYVGFVHIKGLEKTLSAEIAVERMKRGAYSSMENFLERVPMSLEQIRILIRIGALRTTGKNKQRLLWEAMLYFSRKRTKEVTSALFDTQPKEFPLPSLQRKPIEDAFDEIELLGFPLCEPFQLLASADKGDSVAEELPGKSGQHVRIVGYIVTIKDTATKNKAHMSFATFYDCEGNVFDTVHFPDILKRYPLRGRGFYEIKGKVTSDFGVPIIEVTWLDKLPMINKRAEEFMRENIHEMKASN